MEGGEWIWGFTVSRGSLVGGWEGGLRDGLGRADG